MEALLTQRDCCTPTCPEDSQIITTVPGAPGVDGEDGAPGTPGANAYTTVTNPFTMPPEHVDPSPGPPEVEEVLGERTIDVGNTAWMVPAVGNVPGQIISIKHAGRLEVRSIVSATQVVVRNIAKASKGIYPGNANAGAVIPVGAQVGPSGQQGPTGSAPEDAFLIEHNLSEGVAATMRTNLELGTAAQRDVGRAKDQLPPVIPAGGLTSGQVVFATSAGIESKPPGDVRTALGLGDMALQFKNAVQITGGGIAGLDPVLQLSDGGTGVETLAELQALLGMFPGYGLIGVLRGVSLAAIADTPITMKSPRYRIDRITVANSTADITSAKATVVNSGATLIIADETALSAIANSTEDLVDMTLNNPNGTRKIRLESQLIFRVTVVQGGGPPEPKVDVLIFGWGLTA